MHSIAPRLLVVAHGTASAAGRITTERLMQAVRAKRPSTQVELCFLDVVEPRLPAALDTTPTVVVPLLLSSGYHVQTDIPAAIAEHPRTRVAPHLGPHPLLIDVLVDRLGPLDTVASVALVGADSSRSQAAQELALAGALLGERLTRPVTVRTVADDLDQALACLPAPVRVATYLLAEGRFVTTLGETVDRAGATASEPLGVHPALVELVWLRYQEALGPVR